MDEQISTSSRDLWQKDFLIVLRALSPKQRGSLIRAVLAKAEATQDKRLLAAVEQLKQEFLKPGADGVLKILK